MIDFHTLSLKIWSISILWCIIRKSRSFVELNIKITKNINNGLYCSVNLTFLISIFNSKIKYTADAVRAFQKTFGLAVTGTVTPTVWDALYRVYIDIINSVTPTLANQGYPGYDLRRGSSGEAVRLMQRYLNTISSELYPAIPALNEDGVYGEATENAVLTFQRSTGLNATGVIDVTTWERIAELYNFGILR